jgi:hypothetical protein
LEGKARGETIERLGAPGDCDTLTRNTGLTGKLMSFWRSRRGGLVLLVLVVGAGIYVYTSRANRDNNGAIQREGQVDAFELRVGDCYDEERGAIAASLTEVFSVPAVPCGQPHDNEVFAVFDVDLQSFPEVDVMDEIAFDGCVEYFEPYVAGPWEQPITNEHGWAAIV